MARGEWNDNFKPGIPGFYHRMIQLAQETAQNISGILAMPVKGDWGPVKQIVSIDGEKKLKDYFGVNMNYTAYKLGSLALKGHPEKLMLYRLADENAATGKATLANSEGTNVIEFETIYPSERDFRLSVTSNVVNATNKDISLMEGTTLLSKVENVEGTLEEIVDLLNKSNFGNYVKATLSSGATGSLANVTSVQFTGGNNGLAGITNADYTEFMNIIMAYEIDGFVLDGVSDPALISSMKNWGDECKKEGSDFLIFSSTNELTLNAANQKSKSYNSLFMHNGFAKTFTYDKVEYTMAEAMVYFAALVLSKNLKESVCNQVTIFDDVQPRLKKSEITSALEAGTMVFTINKKGQVIIVDDVNTYKDYEKESDKVLGNARAVRFVNTVHKACAVKSEDDFIGKIESSETGQTIILSGFKNFFDEWKRLGIISGYTAETDQENQKNAESDEYFWNWSANYINVTKRIYSSGSIKG